jgi:hypothetical protein
VWALRTQVPIFRPTANLLTFPFVLRTTFAFCHSAPSIPPETYLDAITEAGLAIEMLFIPIGGNHERKQSQARRDCGYSLRRHSGGSSMVYLLLEILVCVFAVLVFGTLAFVLFAAGLLIREALTRVFITLQESGEHISQFVSGRRGYSLERSRTVPNLRQSANSLAPHIRERRPQPVARLFGQVSGAIRPPSQLVQSGGRFRQ